ncbi:hypothetical protein GMRT_13547 [Giardia muris]|uniref:THUMP domain-containing protein n=1 Tax=Giardia muris TaxID=5742 RepID=A0A4Z1T9U4_GIAMU|nr:hypothetical protein GMRT_13547 [Giardia muris]|eukprot:TNJ29967.1 hypothetical protein GMRT_13547 [Giardia muris]
MGKPVYKYRSSNAESIPASAIGILATSSSTDDRLIARELRTVILGYVPAFSQSTEAISDVAGEVAFLKSRASLVSIETGVRGIGMMSWSGGPNPLEVHQALLTAARAGKAFFHLSRIYPVLCIVPARPKAIAVALSEALNSHLSKMEVTSEKLYLQLDIKVRNNSGLTGSDILKETSPAILKTLDDRKIEGHILAAAGDLTLLVHVCRKRAFCGIVPPDRVSNFSVTTAASKENAEHPSTTTGSKDSF